MWQIIEIRNKTAGYAVSIIKAGATIVGHDAGPVRPPLTDLKPAEVEQLAALIAGVGMLLATVGGPLFAFIAICFAALGFKSAASLFWPIPQGYFDARVSAVAIALINSIGNLGGFVAPYTFGVLKQQTGSIQGGLYGLAVTSVLAAGLVFFARTTPKTPHGHHS